jgi:hypothetical protein
MFQALASKFLGRGDDTHFTADLLYFSGYRGDWGFPDLPGTG